MATYRGLGGWVGVGEEGTWGTGVGPEDFNPLKSGSDGVNFERDDLEIDDITSRAQDTAQRYVGSRRISGTISGDIFYDGLFFKRVLEQAVLHDVGAPAESPTGVHTHTFNSSTTTTPMSGKGLSFTLNRGNAAMDHRYEGCKVNGLTVNFDPDGTAEFSADILGKAYAEKTGGDLSTYAAPTGPRVITRTTSNTLGLKVGTGGSADTALVCRSASLSISNNYEERRDIAGLAMLEPTPGMSEVTLDVEVEWDDNLNALRGAWYTDGNSAAIPTRQHVEFAVLGPIITGSSPYKHLVVLERAHVVATPEPHAAGFGVTTANLSFRGFSDSGISPLQYVIVNATSSS